MIPFALLQTIGRSLLAHPWIYAKTMPTEPHWYTLRRDWTEDAAFVTAVEAIRTYGYPERYKQSQYTRLNINGMKYWTMGAPVPATILINRAALDVRPAPYDPIAPHYDTAFADSASVAETEAVMDLVGDVTQSHVLDIGCGTGTVLDFLRPQAYTGIDPSQAMLTELARKHPTAATSVIRTPLEEFVGTAYDVALCLFGAANYIPAEVVSQIPLLIRPGGRYLVMFFAPGYVPVTYARTGHVVSHYDGVHATLPGHVTTLGHFVVVQGVI